MISPRLTEMKCTYQEPNSGEDLIERLALDQVCVGDCYGWAEQVPVLVSCLRQGIPPFPKEPCHHFSIIPRCGMLVSRGCGKHQEGKWDPLPVFINSHENEQQEFPVTDSKSAVKNDLRIMAIFPSRFSHLRYCYADLKPFILRCPRLIMKYSTTKHRRKAW